LALQECEEVCGPELHSGLQSLRCLELPFHNFSSRLKKISNMRNLVSRWSLSKDPKFKNQSLLITRIKLRSQRKKKVKIQTLLGKI